MPLPRAAIKAADTPADEYGRTVADAFKFLARSDVALLAVRITDDAVTYLGLEPTAVIMALSAFPDKEPMPCEFHATVRQTVLGSRAAIRLSLQRETR